MDAVHQTVQFTSVQGSRGARAVWRQLYAKVRVVRCLLGALLGFGAVNALAGGYYGLAGAEGVPREWLEGSPFTDYYVPSLILFTVVGGVLWFAMIAVFAGLRIARLAALSAGTIVLGWITVQVTIIGYVSWMQLATAVGGLLVVVLARLLPRSRGQKY